MKTKMDKIMDVLDWYHDQMCPKCGLKTEVHGYYHDGEWCGKTKWSYPYSYCECGWDHIIDCRDKLPDEIYLDAIEEIVYND